MRRSGFSLVELSIVLVILGLLVGGVLTAQNLVRAAELRSVTTEFQSYQTAAMTFKDKYFALPGDMANATDFWGSFNSGCLNYVNPPQYGSTVCNGNGDGFLSSDIEAAINTPSVEMHQFWRHLSSSQLIDGLYSGTRAGAANYFITVIGVNAPTSKLPLAGWTAISLSNSFSGSTNAYNVRYGNFFLFGSNQANSLPQGPVLTPQEAWNIDRKIDDGLPAQGIIIARFWNDLCAAANNGSHSKDNFDASYKVSDNSVQCALYFLNAF